MENYKMTVFKRILLAILAVTMLSTQQSFTTPATVTPPINLSGDQDCINPLWFLAVGATFLITAIAFSSFCSKRSEPTIPPTPAELLSRINSFKERVESKLGQELQEVTILAIEGQNHNEARKSLELLIKSHFTNFFECSQHIHVVKNICTSFIKESKVCLLKTIKYINEETNQHDLIMLRQEKNKLKELKKLLKTFEKTIKWRYWGEHMSREFFNMMMREICRVTRGLSYSYERPGDYYFSCEGERDREQFPYVTSEFQDSCSKLYSYYNQTS